MQVRRYGELAGSFAAFMQQASYITLVSVGAYIAISGHDLTMGALIASSILSGRILAPIAALPGLMVQWAHARAALLELENMFTLQTDNFGVTNALTPNASEGSFGCRISFSRIPVGRTPCGSPSSPSRQEIRWGAWCHRLWQKHAVETAGWPLQTGAGQRPARWSGYPAHRPQPPERTHRLLPQSGRLFAGTLRDNLLFGMFGISEEDVLNACRMTGLDAAITNHPKG